MIFIILIALTFKKPVFSNTEQKMFEQLTTISKMNDYLGVRILGKELGKYGTEIHILIENRSKKNITMSSDPNLPPIKLFTFENDKWIEVENNVTYWSMTDEDHTTLFHHGTGHGESFTTMVRPKFDSEIIDEKKQKPLRIFVFGELLSDGEVTGTPVGAYVDLYVEP